MSRKNVISIDFQTINVHEIKDFIANIKGKLPSSLITLSREERLCYSKVGEKTIDFIEKSFNFAHYYPQLVPMFIDINELKKDMESVKEMLSILRMLEELTKKLDDSILLASQDAYTSALLIYAAAKDASRRNVTGANEIVEELRERYLISRNKDIESAANNNQRTMNSWQ